MDVSFVLGLNRSVCLLRFFCVGNGSRSPPLLSVPVFRGKTVPRGTGNELDEQSPGIYIRAGRRNRFRRAGQSCRSPPQKNTKRFSKFHRALAAALQPIWGSIYVQPAANSAKAAQVLSGGLQINRRHGRRLPRFWASRSTKTGDYGRSQSRRLEGSASRQSRRTANAGALYLAK